MKKDNNKTQVTKSFKILIVLLVFSMLRSLFYIYKMSDRSKKIIISLREEKAIVLKDLEKSDLFLQQIMTSNKSLSKKLAIEQSKIKKLIAELKSKSVTENNIAGYKKSANNADARIKELLNEINNYKNKIDSTNVVLGNERIKVDTLTTSNKKLTKTIDKAAKLYFYNLNYGTFKDKGEGKLVETTKSNRINLIKISFMIAENNLVKASNKDFYVQIIDSKANVVGLKNTLKIGAQELTYSAVLKTNYKNETTKVEGEIAVDNLTEGTYFINVFDKSKLILNTSFTLK